MRSIGIIGRGLLPTVYQSRYIGIKIGRDIDIDINDTDFFKVKPSPPRYLYPEMYHPKKTNSDNKPTINIDINSKISISMNNVRTVNISYGLNDISKQEN